MHRLRFLIIALCFCLTGFSLHAQTRLASLFTSNMVLQHNEEVKIWGWGIPGETLSISFAKKNYQAIVKQDSSWVTTINTGDPGGPYSLTVGRLLQLENILLGDVWICSGQSNMLRSVKRSANPEKEISNGGHPSIRLLDVEKVMSGTEQKEVSTTGWKVCSPETVGDFSATAYYFARELQKVHSIPIGLISSNWGGTRIEQWMDAYSLNTIPGYGEKLLNVPSAGVTKETFLIEQYETGYDAITMSDTAYAYRWRNENRFDTTRSIQLPGAWEKTALPAYDGTVWFRKNITLPASFTGKDVYLSLGKIDERDITWFNGVQAGTTRGAGLERVYRISKELLKEGSNTITVLVTDLNGEGGFTGETASMKICSDSACRQTIVSVAGKWFYQTGIKLDKELIRPPHPYSFIRPSMLYNAMIAPLTGFAVKGFLWYQGENDTKSYNDAATYQALFPAMINGWRRNWNKGDLPFLFVQLSSFGAVVQEPGESIWARLRESQASALTLKNTAMAVTIDIGDPADIHFLNKQEVGARLAKAAAANVYKKGIAGSGPLFSYYQIQGDKIIIHFTEVGKGLTIKGGGSLKGFSIAGADGHFVWADAVINKQAVIVSAKQVADPKMVRYAWADSPVAANLFNKDGLPAAPFRTDKNGVLIK